MQEKFLQNGANALRMISAAAVEKAASGHPGMPLGFADVFTTLVAEFLRFNPAEPKWLGRDRLVLSAGHGAMLLYGFYYLTGYKNFGLQEIKNFRQLNSMAAGHPEYGLYQAIETTTGPLGQGFATSVGLAIAAKKQQAKLGRAICDYKTYCIVGDGCLMEGISYEAASLAGHLQLDNLIVLFDDNNISIDGDVSLTCSEKQLLKFQSLGWETMAIDGHDFVQIRSSLTAAQNSTKPVFIACKTTIGKFSNKAGNASCHGTPLGSESFAALKQSLNWHEDGFVIPEDILNLWRSFGQRNKPFFEQWCHRFALLSKSDQQYLQPFTFTAHLAERLVALDTLPSQATRFSVAQILQVLLQEEEKIVIGSADLSDSVGVINNFTRPISKQDFSGNFIHYGVREHAMAAIMNGLALNGFMPIAGTFLVFSDYMRPAIRMASLMELAPIYLMTHDSIGLGQDGPTHQPVEHLASLRCMPNLSVYRPADFAESVGVFLSIMNNSCPSLIALSRQTIASTGLTKADQVSKGAYFLIKNNVAAPITIFASGSEVSIAAAVVSNLASQGIIADLVSVPCFELFWLQSVSYIDSIVNNSTFKVAIEAAVAFGWHSIIGENGLFFGVQTFGKSAPADDLYNYFKLNATDISQTILKAYENRN